jgi:hypothetical protein
LSRAEESVVRRIKRAKLFPFLRRIRLQLFDAAFQDELATLYAAVPVGQPPVSPAKLALVTLLQAYTGASDDEAIEALVMDRRWQLVLDCLDGETAPLGKGTLVRFRAALIAAGLDRRLIERTVALADQDRGVNARSLRAALDSSPLWGAGRVEDTYNLLGHALRKAVGVLARQVGRELAAVATELGAGLLTGSSLKAALDCDWDDPDQRQQALATILATLEAVEQAVAAQPAPTADPATGRVGPRPGEAELAIAQAVRQQDVTTAADGQPGLQAGVARDRRISVEDPAMRHGRKSRTQRFDGFKRHVLSDLDLEVIRAVGLTAANVPDAAVTDALEADLAPQEVTIAELHIDRAYLSSRLVRDRPPELTVIGKAWPVRNGDRFTKAAFVLDWEAETVRCPNEVEVPLRVGQTVHFPEASCAACPLREQCTTSPHGRSVSIHPDERLLVELRERQATPAGRAKLRERVAVEHDLSHVGRVQGRRARYLGERKNLFDLRRSAVVVNLHTLLRRETAKTQAAA